LNAKQQKAQNSTRLVKYYRAFFSWNTKPSVEQTLKKKQAEKNKSWGHTDLKNCS